MKIFGLEIKRAKPSLKDRVEALEGLEKRVDELEALKERVEELEGFVDELDGDLLDHMEEVDGKLIKFKKDINVFVDMVDVIFRGMQGRIDALEKKADKRTVSDMTTEEEKPVGMDQIIDEWVNGKEGED